MVFCLVEGQGWCLLALMLLRFGQSMAQDTPTPVCQPPAPICRSYEISSCEWALNMVPVYVCRTDLGSILGLGIGYQPRPQVIYQAPISQQTVFPSYVPQQPQPVYPPPQPQPVYASPQPQPVYASPQPQPVYTTYTTRTPAQYRPAPQFLTGRDTEQNAQGSSQNSQSGTGAQPGGFANRAQGQAVFQGAAREAPSRNEQPQPSANSPSQQSVGYAQRSGTPMYQAAPQPSSAAGSQQPVITQSSYPGNQAMVNEVAE